MLALGIGGSVSVFSIFYSAPLRPLPFAEPDRLVELHETSLARGVDQAAFSEANFWDVRAQSHAFSMRARIRKTMAISLAQDQPRK